MILNFIAAACGTALVKNLITNESYPNVVEVNSFTHESNDLIRTAEIIKLHAGQGNALLTGKLTKRLENESRAGHCSREPLDYLILDIDSNDLPYTRDELVTMVCSQPTQYIFQHSASSTSDDSIRGHYWIKLTNPTTPEHVKRFLKHVNFSNLEAHIKLSSSKTTLKWPLDIVVNDPGRIVFIAPPVCNTDPITERIVVNQYGAESFSIPDDVPDRDIHAFINQLREGETLPKRAKPENEIIDVDANTKVTGVKENKEFVYLNINGGDSWAYYFSTNNPEIVRNFKGDYNFRLRDLAPELYKQYKQSVPVDDPNLRLVDGKLTTLKPAVFRDFNTDVYWQVLYNPANNEISKAGPSSSREKLNDFMRTNGEAKPKMIFDGKVEFDPSNTVLWDPNTRYLNVFKSTRLMEIQETSNTVPRYIDRLIRHLTVDRECYDHFMNWLAFIYQYRNRTGTAWLLHGHTGTGKGTLYSQILRPIFGSGAKTCNSSNITDQFNDQIRTSVIMFVDEFDINDINEGNRKFNTLKSYITEEELTIRKMRTDPFQAKNYCNFIFASNSHVPVKIDESERRLNIPPRQDRSLEGLCDFRDLLDDELEGFCRYLKGYKVNVAQARRPVLNAARIQMIANSRTSIEEFFLAVKRGDIEFFLDYVGHAEIEHILLQQNFETIVKRWIDEMKTSPVEVTRDELLICYRYIIEPIKPLTPIKFSAICRNNGVEFDSKRINSSPRYYYRTTEFKLTETSAQTTQPTKHKDNVIKLG